MSNPAWATHLLRTDFSNRAWNKHQQAKKAKCHDEAIPIYCKNIYVKTRGNIEHYYQQQ
jgi:hypothetical protein